MRKRYDLDLLRSLQALIEEEGVSHAARRLQMSEAAMSRSLAKLRVVFNDPILVASGRRMVVTTFALGLRERLRAIVDGADSLLEEQDTPDIASLSPHFMLRANDLIVGAFGAAILAALRHDCPGCTLTFVPETDDEPSNDLREGHIDLYLGASDDMRPEIRRQSIFPTAFRGLVRADHPILAEGITPDSIARYEHISVSRRGRLHGPIDTVLKEQFGLRRQVVMVVPTYYAMVETLRMTDMILPLPGIAIDYLPIRSMHLAEFEFPFALPTVHSFQAWHPRRDGDPVHRWLRNTVYRVVRERGEGLPEGFTPPSGP
ncbi:LysR family transcriptional regulator [Komagataeibacter nataicola]|uniref:LysR family transcriptional regulator n=1 Tax=Komagataeibacter nataicola TaxID=265960 RepID=A0A9N7C3I9_9PROT|nr:LysR family transcriptional regulator [Komagataeibacter nataicola]AQU86143.1 LysR family transcriptional regulator [Komagataeibacter nataicola]PYD67355.1 LysR family transcriptional regulator [Komagataeibacter nataicola]WNM08452.1 LysR family transcriptional regulator [Komagataeibacter nataicola]GBR20736.1 LysR family transcriptional regulator [Komagataeibacter nataicola NRIC 0616]